MQAPQSPSPLAESDSTLSTAAAPSQSARGHIRALDGVRGLAVLLVLLDHASDAEMRFFPQAILNRAGQYGVYLFFVLSAFLLTWLPLVVRREEVTKVRTWTNYFLRRFLRIFPIYAVVLLALSAMGKLKLSQVGPHLLLREGHRQFWSIPVEFKYYFLVPLLVLTIYGIWMKKWRLATLSAVGATCLTAGIFAFEKVWTIEDHIALSMYLAPFLFGTAAAVAHLRLSSRGPHALWLQRSLETIAALVLVISIVRIPSIYNAVFFPHKPVGKFGYDPLICGALWSVFLLCTLHGRGFLRRAMEWMPLRYLGLISFSAYLWHERFLSDFDDLPVPSPLRLLVFLAVVIAVSSVSYFLIERPLSRIRLKPAKRLVNPVG